MTARDALAAIRARSTSPWNVADIDQMRTRDVPALVEIAHAVVELAHNYGVRAKHAPTPLAQWADIEADLRRALERLEGR